MERISATDAARHFSDLLNRVRYQGRRFEITRGTEVIAQVLPIKPPGTARLIDLDRQFAQIPILDAQDTADFEEDIKTIRRAAIVPDPSWD